MAPGLVEGHELRHVRLGELVSSADALAIVSHNDSHKHEARAGYPRRGSPAAISRRTQHLWLRTNGVNTNGAAAKDMRFDRLGKRYALALLGGYKQINGSTQKRSL